MTPSHNLEIMAKITFVKFTVVLAVTFSLLQSLFPAEPCLGAKQTAKEKVAERPLVDDKIRDYQERLDRLLSPIEYQYSPAGKPDPFKPFFRANVSVHKRARKAARRPSSCDTPLQCMDVGQLTLVGIVQEENGNVLAMAQDASGIGYTLRKGMKVGYQNGEVIAIKKDRLIVREQVEGIKGDLTFRDRVLYLHPEESNETSQ